MALPALAFTLVVVIIFWEIAMFLAGFGIYQAYKRKRMVSLLSISLLALGLHVNGILVEGVVVGINLLCLVIVLRLILWILDKIAGQPAGPNKVGVSPKREIAKDGG
jgi:hypothetical protein